MNFKQLIGKYLSGNFPSEQLSQIGVIGLYEGFDSPSLCILAGLSRNESSYIADRYLKSTLEELGISLPEKRQSALLYALGITEDILEGRTELIAGVWEIKSKAIDCYDFYSETKHYVYDSIGFELLYGLFDEYDDLINEYIPGHSQEPINKVKILLFEELKIWNIKLKLICE